MKKYLIVMLAAAALFVSCKPEDPAEITLTKKTVSVSSSDAQASLSFTTNYDWTAQTDASWLTLDKASGAAGSASISVKLEAAQLNDRTGNVVIFCRDVKDTIFVVQKQKDQILLSEKTKTVSQDGGTFDVSFGTNVAYQVVIPAEVTWIKTVGLKSYETKTVNFTYEANDTYDERKALITFKSTSSDVTDVLEVTQPAKNGLIVNPAQIEIDNLAQTIQTEVLYNVDYEVKISADWLQPVRDNTKALKSDKYKFSVTENTTKGTRTATVTFASPKAGLKQVLTVVQSGSSSKELVFVVKASTYTLPEIAGDAVVGTVDWGDGSVEPYSLFASHIYNSFGTYTVRVSTFYSRSFDFKTITDLQEIDLSSF